VQGQLRSLHVDTVAAFIILLPTDSAGSDFG
jgi:hypothetical protein